MLTYYACTHSSMDALGAVWSEESYPTKLQLVDILLSRSSVHRCATFKAPTLQLID